MIEHQNLGENSSPSHYFAQEDEALTSAEWRCLLAGLASCDKIRHDADARANRPGSTVAALHLRFVQRSSRMSSKSARQILCGVLRKGACKLEGCRLKGDDRFADAGGSRLLPRQIRGKTLPAGAD